jgi:DNA replication protein DnaC
LVHRRKAKGAIDSELKKIEKNSLLILNDGFIVPLDPKEKALLLEIIEDRYGRMSTIITSQLPVFNWYDAIIRNTTIPMQS